MPSQRVELPGRGLTRVHAAVRFVAANAFFGHYTPPLDTTNLATNIVSVKLVCSAFWAFGNNGEIKQSSNCTND